MRYTGDTPVSVLTKLGVGIYTTTQLEQHGITDLWHLAACSDDILLHLDQIGTSSLMRLDLALERIGWSRQPSHGTSSLRLPAAIYHHLLRGGWTTIAGLRHALKEGSDFQLDNEALTIIQQKLDAFRPGDSCSTHD